MLLASLSRASPAAAELRARAAAVATPLLLARGLRKEGPTTACPFSPSSSGTRFGAARWASWWIVGSSAHPDTTAAPAVPVCWRQRGDAGTRRTAAKLPMTMLLVRSARRITRASLRVQSNGGDKGTGSSKEEAELPAADGSLAANGDGGKQGKPVAARRRGQPAARHASEPEKPVEGKLRSVEVQVRQRGRKSALVLNEPIEETAPATKLHHGMPASKTRAKVEVTATARAPRSSGRKKAGAQATSTVVEAEPGVPAPAKKRRQVKQVPKPAVEPRLPSNVVDSAGAAQTAQVAAEAASTEPWTRLVHKRPAEDWVAYNPATMRPLLPDERHGLVKVVSWNVNGLRAVMRAVSEGGDGDEQARLLEELVLREDPDVICLQETKLQDKDVDKVRSQVPLSYKSTYWNCSNARLGYSGTALLSKEEPISVRCGMGIDDHDKEGRLITAEYEGHYVVVCYVPNSGDQLVRLDYRQHQWDCSLSAYLKMLEQTKPVILTGDLNCAYEEIVIYNPMGNKRSAGFTVEERESFAKHYLQNGFVDTFRRQHPKKVAYTYWGYRMKTRPKNQGWRLDYFLVSEHLYDRVLDSYTIPDFPGSDHCPLGLIFRAA
eukprot:SM000030S11365  [mRNA]  locus=s30:292559:296336:- [translate_table: standard]